MPQFYLSLLKERLDIPLEGQETFIIKLRFCGVQGFYEYIDRASVLDYLKQFLNHEDPNLRAKACSALGNMCRNSSYFYDSLVSIQLRFL